MAAASYGSPSRRRCSCACHLIRFDVGESARIARFGACVLVRGKGREGGREGRGGNRFRGSHLESQKPGSLELSDVARSQRPCFRALNLPEAPNASSTHKRRGRADPHHLVTIRPFARGPADKRRGKRGGIRRAGTLRKRLCRLCAAFCCGLQNWAALREGEGCECLLPCGQCRGPTCR